MANNSPLRLLYAGPFLSREAALDKIDDLFAIGELSAIDSPDIIRYGTGLRGNNQRNHWHVTVLAGEG